MYTILMLSSGALWTLSYGLIIRRGFLDHTYGMPLAALCANLSWEFTFSFLHLSPSPTQRVVNLIWLLLDLVILLQVLRYGPREHSEVPLWAFFAAVAVGMATALTAVLLISVEFDDWAGAYAAFGQNLMMSILFVAMLVRRGSLRGQSLGIAVGKLLGTGCASLAFVLYAPAFQASVLLPFLAIAIFAYDLLYVGLVYLVARAGSPVAVFGGAHGERMPIV